VKIYVAALEALRKNKRSWSKHDETQDKFLSYKFIGHVAYVMRPWFYSPFQECSMLKFVQVHLTISVQFHFLNFLKPPPKTQNSKLIPLHLCNFFINNAKHVQALLHIVIQVHFFNTLQVQTTCNRYENLLVGDDKQKIIKPYSLRWIVMIV
jgi:hypothetical protein